MKKHNKYTHILYRNEPKFSSLLMRMIQENPDIFKSEDHLLVTPYKEVFEIIKGYKHAVLDTSGQNLIKRYIRQSDWVIAHSISSKTDIAMLSKKECKKTIIRYWGALSFENGHVEGQKVKNTLRDFQYKLFKRNLYRIAALGVANISDINDIKNRFPNYDVPIYRLPYKLRGDTDFVRNLIGKRDVHDGVNIMVGHRGMPELNHLPIVKLLAEKYANENVKIYVPLSYGAPQYMETILPELKRYKNVIPVVDFMEYDKYVEFIHSMDAGVFDGLSSFALGNIALFIDFGITLCLNKNGIIGKTFEELHIPYVKISDLNNARLEDLSSPAAYSEEADYWLGVSTFENRMQGWISLQNDFN